MRAVFGLYISLFLCGCATTGGNAYPDHSFASQTLEDTGIASYYSDSLHGRSTASGEPYDKYELTAAHRKLKFGTWVKVTNLTNDQAVIVRINDRGPFVRGRVIDLSRQAAEEVGLIGPGLAQVKLEIVSPP